MRYEQVWNAVDKLAKQNGLSPSGLAKKSGLDSTTFNKSKRIRPDGKKRWPSLDSINKVLEVCNASFEDFYKLATENKEVELKNSIPYIKYSKLKSFDKMNKVEIDTSSWGKIKFPDCADNLYAIDIDATKFSPLYRFGSVVIASKNSEVRHRDRIVIITEDGEIMLNEFLKRTAKSVIVTDLTDSEKELEVQIKNIKLINRIVWASQ